MRTLLILVLSLAIAGSAAAAPDYACVVKTTAISASFHTCCDGPAITTPPIGSCCVVSTPIQRASGTSTREAIPDQRVVAIPHTRQGIVTNDRHGAWDTSPPLLRVAAVPLYLQQLSLLI
jgi:hypothetical protein